MRTIPAATSAEALSWDAPNRVAPIRKLSDASIMTMIADFSKKKWHKNERDAAFARESIEGLRCEMARRRAAAVA